MMMKRSIIYTIVLALIAGLYGFVKLDDDVIKKAAAQLSRWTTDYPQEKVYLHMDKPYYAIGDDIWFKAYVTVGGKHQLSALSGILNVELIDDRDSVKKALKLPLIAGLAWGDFKLADSLAEGNYRVRAYTNWMRNAGDDYFFDQTIAVGNAISNTVFTKADYTYTATAKGQQQVNAKVNYADLEGKPYAGKEVSYEVQLNNKTASRGKGVTDDEGNLNLSFANNSPFGLKNGDIITTVKLSPAQKVVKILPVKASSGKIDVQFFPESGSLVNNVRTKVAFKATGADGLGADIKGTVTDDQNQEVAQLTTRHLGMGVFTFTPQPGKTYTAKITYPDGTDGTMQLPKAADRGYILNVYNNDPNFVVVKISAGEATFNENKDTEISLVAQSGGNLIYTAKNKLEVPAFSAKIARSRFQSGIVQFTLFSASGEPLNERIAFIQNPDLLNLSLSTAKASYAPREKVNLNLSAKYKDSKPVIGSFSVAVIDESKVQIDEASESTILSNLLLSSDIKGYIEKPNYYFTNVNDDTKANLDILMLTQGYRRFEWKQIMNNNFPVAAFKPEKSLDIAGHIKTPGGKPVPKGKVSLLSTTGGMFLLDTLTDEQGAFVFKNLIFKDSVKFVVQARNAKGGKNVEIELDNISPQVVTHNKNSPDIQVNVNSKMALYLQNSKTQYDDFLKYGLVNKTIMLKGVTISDKRAPLKNSSNLNGAGNADQVVKSDQLQSCVTISQCLQGRLLGVIFRGGVPYSTRSLNTPMAIYVDGINFSDTNLDDLNIFDVESIEVLRSAAYTSIYGMNGGGGVLLITTKRGEPNYGYQRYTPGVITYTPRGYYKAREFYAPEYDSPKTNAKVADLRTTIYWKPNIITDKDGNSALTFFNADSKGTYKAVVEGIDSDGNLGRQVFRYKVE